MMLRRALDAEVDVKELEAAGLMLLRAYGVPETEAKRISRLRLPELPNVPVANRRDQQFRRRLNSSRPS